jgi:hypothetical protein
MLCPKCKNELNAALAAAQPVLYCGQCGSRVRVHVFPALYRQAESRAAAERDKQAAEASCFFHSEKKAETACAGCGRFLCTVCVIESGGRTLCPVCFEEKKDAGQSPLEKERFRYDKLAATLAVLSIVMCWFSFITAPVVLYIVFRYYKKPLSLTKASGIPFSARLRYWFALLTALGLLAGWFYIIADMILKWR